MLSNLKWLGVLGVLVWLEAAQAAQTAEHKLQVVRAQARSIFEELDADKDMALSEAELGEMPRTVLRELVHLRKKQIIGAGVPLPPVPPTQLTWDGGEVLTLDQFAELFLAEAVRQDQESRKLQTLGGQVLPLQVTQSALQKSSGGSKTESSKDEKREEKDDRDSEKEKQKKKQEQEERERLQRERERQDASAQSQYQPPTGSASSSGQGSATGNSSGVSGGGPDRDREGPPRNTTTGKGPGPAFRSPQTGSKGPASFPPQHREEVKPDRARGSDTNSGRTAGRGMPEPSRPDSNRDRKPETARDRDSGKRSEPGRREEPRREEPKREQRREEPKREQRREEPRRESPKREERKEPPRKEPERRPEPVRSDSRGAGKSVRGR